MPTIRLEKVAKIYKGKNRQSAAILNIDLTIEQGDFVFFIGSRGAGKSTLLDIISGNLKPDRGAVYLDDMNLNRLTSRQKAKLRHCMGRVPQDSELRRTETVFKNMASTKKLEFLKDKLLNEKQIQKALGLVGMSGCEEKYPLEMTPSECRRIEMAKAILRSPSILLLDEITDRVDDDTVWDMLHLISELNARGTTILMATSARRVVNIMRKRVVTLADGKIVGDVRKGKYGHIV